MPAITKNHSTDSIVFFDELYRTLSDQAGEAIFVVDLKGVIIYANPAVKAIAGFSPVEYVGKHFEKFVDKGSLEKAWEFFKKVKSKKTIFRDELNVINRNGEIVPVEFTASPILRDGRIIQVHSIVRNISQKKFKEDSLRGTEKLKTVQHLISGTVKEIQHPLKVVYEHLDSLFSTYKDKSFEYVGFKEFKSILDSLSLMRDEVRNCYQTTQKLLLLNKKRVGLDHQGCDPNEVIKEVCALFEHELEASNIELKLHLDRKLKKALIGNLELNQVIVNILNNAIQAIPNQGQIDLRTFFDHERHRIGIECKDSGMGISKEALKHIFEPFFTTKKNEGRKNLGLGLSICYAILQSVKGEIYIKSSLKQGTIVTIFLPVKK